MVKLIINEPPESAMRPTYVPDFGRAVTPKKYLQYKNKLIGIFNKEYADNEELRDVLRNSKYGINLKVLFKFDKRNSNRPYHRQRPDLDNLVKATVDALFQSDANRDYLGIKIDEDGNEYPDYKLITDDSNIVRMELMKINVPADEVGQEIIIKKMLEED